MFVRIEIITPDAEPDPEVFKREWQDVLNKARRRMRDKFIRTTRTYKKVKVKFAARTINDRDNLAVEVSTDNEVYMRLVKGTGSRRRDGGGKAYVITGKGGGPLRYKSQFQAQTTPGSRFAKAGGKSEPWVTRQAVVHPGIEPRNFDTLIAAEEQPVLEKELAAASKRAARKLKKRKR